MQFRPFLVGLALTAAPLPVLAQDWQPDPSHSSIVFSIEHFGFSDIQGTFRDFDVDVSFDPDDLEATAATVTIDAASIDTFWEARDEHIRSADMFDVETWPEIVFTTSDVEMLDETTAKISGDLTLHGVTHPVTFDAVLNKIAANPFDDSKRNAGFTITGEIDRTLFGVDYAAPLVAAKVPVTINIELTGPAE